MLYVARLDRPEQHRGAVVQIERSPFAPSDLLLRDAGNGVVGPVAFRARYAWELRVLWKQDRQAFLTLIEQARGGGDVTLVDEWEDEASAPRRVLAAALKQIASVERANARRQERDLSAYRSSSIDDLESRPYPNAQPCLVLVSRTITIACWPLAWSGARAASWAPRGR